MKTINWITGGAISNNWAYGTNTRRLISKLTNYNHQIDNFEIGCDIVVFFDVLLMEKYHRQFPLAEKILRLSGIRPFTKLKINKKDLINHADCVVCTNKYLSDIIYHYNKKIIPNSIDISLFNSDNYTHPEQFTVGFSGNIANDKQKEWKGYDLFLYAVKKMNLNFKITSRNIDEIKHQNMTKDFYHQISCLILPSISEGCSNTVSEALACGIPVILCNENPSYHTENLIDGYNILFCERTLNSVCNCIRLAQDQVMWKRLSDNSQSFIRENQALDVVVEQWKEVLC